MEIVVAVLMVIVALLFVGKPCTLLAIPKGAANRPMDRV
jgi:hypothetical protein